MKPAIVNILDALASLGGAIGLEGAFLIVGALLLGIGASYFHPAGPYLVTGGLAVLIGIVLALPARSR
jgi:hypothetical protein